MLRERFRLACRRLGLNSARAAELDTKAFRPPGGSGQLEFQLQE